MFRQLGTKSRLNQTSLQLLEQPVLPGQVLRLAVIRQNLVQKFRSDCRISGHVSPLAKVNSQKRTYTTFRTPSRLHVQPLRQMRSDKDLLYPSSAGSMMIRTPDAEFIAGARRAFRLALAVRINAFGLDRREAGGHLVVIRSSLASHSAAFRPRAVERNIVRIALSRTIRAFP